MDKSRTQYSILNIRLRRNSYGKYIFEGSQYEYYVKLCDTSYYAYKIEFKKGAEEIFLCHVGGIGISGGFSGILQICFEHI